MQNCLVVGANSFIGSHLIDSLKRDGPVTGVYHQNTEKLHENILNIPISELNTLDENSYTCVFIVSAYIPE